MSNFNNTGEVKEISILDMMNGAIGERVAYELTRIAATLIPRRKRRGR